MVNRHYYSLLTCLFFLFSEQCLAHKSVHDSIEEMLEYHVEYKEFSPLLAKRSFKLLIDQFDSHKLYLLEQEVDPFLKMTEAHLKEIVQAHAHENYSAYEELGLVIQSSILRARKYREEIVEKLLHEPLSSLEDEMEEEKHFPASLGDLEKRIERQLISFLCLEKKEEEVEEFSTEERRKIFALWEKRLVREENSYLFTRQQPSKSLDIHILKAFAKSLDAHSAYFSEEEAHDLKTTLEKQFEGIGIVLREGRQGVMIKSLVKNGPAEKSGNIQVGDVLVSIDGEDIKACSYEEVLSKLKGGRGEKVTLTLERLQGSISTQEVIDLVRGKVMLEEERVKCFTTPLGQGVIGVIEIPAFYESRDGTSCERDVKEALKQMRSQGELLGLILDLRENSGGFLSQAVKVASLFISSGVIVISKYSEDQMQYLREVNGKISYQGPLIVLTSKASASAAEIVAQALQDYGLALVVGDERTYGKGTIQYQTVTEKGASSYFKVTVGKYYTVSGRSTQIEGVKADLVVPTCYAPFNIGEKYLLYPLKNDQIESAFMDPLLDIAPRSRSWMKKNYLPHVQKKLSFWMEVLPRLQANSESRIRQDKDFLAFKKAIEEKPLKEETFLGFSDLQMQEAIRVVKDMVFFQIQKKCIAKKTKEL